MEGALKMPLKDKIATVMVMLSLIILMVTSCTEDMKFILLGCFVGLPMAILALIILHFE